MLFHRRVQRISTSQRSVSVFNVQFHFRVRLGWNALKFTTSNLQGALEDLPVFIFIGALNITAVPFICKYTYRYQTEETTYHVWLCLCSSSLRDLRLAKNIFLRTIFKMVMSLVAKKFLLSFKNDFIPYSRGLKGFLSSNLDDNATSASAVTTDSALISCDHFSLIYQP